MAVRRILVAALSLLCAVIAPAASSAAEPPAVLWEIADFDAPKSVLYDARTDAFFVSNVHGDPTVRDRNGYISKIGTDGSLIRKYWFRGLDAPKGMAVFGDYLFVADIDQLVVIHKLTGQLLARHPAPDAKYLADVAADGLGRIYVSDMLGNAIYRLQNGAFGKWVASDALKGPNALKVVKDELWVAGWGRVVRGLETSEPGGIVSVDLATGEVEPVGQGLAIGNLDGLEPLGGGRFFVTDWVAGGLLLVDRYGRSQVVADLPQGSGDLGFNPLLGQIVVPLMADGKVVAYRID